MSDKVETKLVSMLDALQNGVAEVGGKIVKYTPDVVNAAEWVVRIDGVQSIVFSVSGMIVMGYASVKIWKFARKIREEDRYSGWADFNNALAVILGIVAALQIRIILDVWNWVRIFEPKLYIAKQIIESVVGAK